MADEGRGQQRPAGWKKDPSGRHYGRYWDGFQWTEYVISAEKVQRPLAFGCDRPDHVVLGLSRSGP